jgi:hypothetical protein
VDVTEIDFTRKSALDLFRRSAARNPAESLGVMFKRLQIQWKGRIETTKVMSYRIGRDASRSFMVSTYFCPFQSFFSPVTPCSYSVLPNVAVHDQRTSSRDFSPRQMQDIEHGSRRFGLIRPGREVKLTANLILVAAVWSLVNCALKHKITIGGPWVVFSVVKKKLLTNIPHA